MQGFTGPFFGIVLETYEGFMPCNLRGPALPTASQQEQAGMPTKRAGLIVGLRPFQTW